MQFPKLSSIKSASVFLIALIGATVVVASERGPVQEQDPASGRSANGPFQAVVSTTDDGRAADPGAVPRVSPADQYGRHIHFVRFGEDSLARYEGDIPGLPATSPRVTGQRIDVESPQAVAYLDFLRSQQESYLSEISQNLRRRVEPRHQYLNVLNAVAVPLTVEEAQKLRGLPFVVDVAIERIEVPDTDVGPELIGAPAFWNGLTTSGDSNRGEGVVIGIIDSGFNHSHPSFAEDSPGDGYVHINPLGPGVFLGVCDDGLEICNNKLIGSYNFHPNNDFGPEDTNSHGTHVASTAGGNPVTATFEGLAIDISGVAPRANLINYKVCEPTCPQASSVAAVDQAIADGIVDILNYSISGTDNPWNSIVDLAFLDAHAAGIFVAASAGNDGPGASTVAKTGPWNATVGNSTHSRLFAQELSVTGGPSGVAAVPGTGPVIESDFIGNLRYAGEVDAENFEGCDAFAANAFDGEAALISRGSCTFATKVNNALDAGAVFVVLYNSTGGPPISAGGLEATTIPTVMVSDQAGAALIAEAGTGVAEITVSAAISSVSDPDFADVMAGGSSRGPSQFNVLKPDFTAPGTNILAAATDARDKFIVIGGTSMASPHAAGSAALIIAEHPDWTPSEVKSALALTATPNLLKENGNTPVDAHDVGSGRLALGGAAVLGFVMNETVANYQAANPDDGGNPATLNQPSIQDWRCPDQCTYERTLRSVLSDDVTYNLSVTAPSGVMITVEPSSFTIPAGGEQSISIVIDVSAAPEDEWLFSEINVTPTDSAVSNVRFPVAVVAVDPAPSIAVSTNALIATQQRNEVTSQTFDITNLGELPLEWSLVELGVQGSDRATFAGPGTLWNNPQIGGSGRINNFSSDDNTGIYQSDAFSLLVTSRVETIFSAGFTLGGPAVTELTWMVFADDNGVPAGHPETDPESALWSFTASLGSPGTSFADDNMFLDLAAAGADELILDPGTYWLVAFPSIQPYSLGPNILFAWRHGAAGTGRQIGPGGLSGFPTTWVGAPEGRAFGLTGSVQCDAEFTPFIDVTPTSGELNADENDTVTVDFYSVGLLEGSYETVLCITSNDPELGFIFLPVQLNVINLPDASISPAELNLTAEFGESTSGQVVLRNDGLGDLEFGVRGAGESSGLLFDGGPVITSSGDGPEGADVSLLQNSSLGLTTLGAAVSPSVEGDHFRVADDFVVPPGGVLIEQVRFFAYQTGSDTTSTFTAANFRIWDGPPGDSTSSIVFGDAVTNRLVDTGWTGAYRLSETTVGTARPIMYIDAEVGVTLTAGTYWLDWQLDGSLPSGPWQPPVTVIGEAITGNALQLISTGWVPFVDGSANTAQGAPFQLFGLADAQCESIDALSWLDTDPQLGTVASEGGEQPVDLIADASAALPGEYSTTVCFETNDGANPVLAVDVNLTVSGEAPDGIFSDRFEESPAN